MKTLDKILLIYSTVVAVGLTASSLSRGFSPENLILLALFLPVTVYFIWTLYRLSRRRQSSANPTDPRPAFSPTAFFSQTNPFFLVTLSLYLALFTAVITKAILNIWPS